jgi:transposase-like protein
MPRSYPPEVRRQVIELARSGTKVSALVEVFGVSEASIYNCALRLSQVTSDASTPTAHIRRRAAPWRDWTSSRSSAGRWLRRLGLATVVADTSQSPSNQRVALARVATVGRGRSRSRSACGR